MVMTMLTSCQKSEAETINTDGQTQATPKVIAQYDIVQMGSCRQNVQTIEPVNWVVLMQDGDRVLLLSRDLLTGKKKDVYKQLDKNPKFELVAIKPDRSGWVRISGVLVDDPDIEPQKEYLRRNPHFNDSYQPGDGNMAMLYITNATARYCSFTGEGDADACEWSIDLDCLRAQFAPGYTHQAAPRQKSLREGGSPNGAVDYAIDHLPLTKGKSIGVRLIATWNPKLGGTVLNQAKELSLLIIPDTTVSASSAT